MARFKDLKIAVESGLSPGTEFDFVWDSVGPPLLPADVGERLEFYLDTFVSELATRVPPGTKIERDGAINSYRIFLTSPKIRGKRAGIAVNIDPHGNALIIYLRRFVPWSRYWMFLPILGIPGRTTAAHHAIADELQKSADAALKATFPEAAPFTWRRDAM